MKKKYYFWKMGCLKLHNYKPLEALRKASREAKVVQLWLSVDPAFAKFPSWNPYSYTLENPINLVDPTGAEGKDWYRDRYGNVSWHNSQENRIKGSNGQTLTRLGKSGSYQNANGGITTLNKDQSVTQDGSSSLAISPQRMSGNALSQHEGGAAMRGGGSQTYESFDTTKYDEGGFAGMPLQSGALIDPSASLFKAYVEAEAGGVLLKGLGAAVSGSAEGETVVLEGAVKSNFQRFLNKMPANSKSNASFQLLNDGNYLFQATSPGKVPGSSALYQKWVNPQGETFKMIKTTFGSDGSIIHVKPKF